MAGMWAVQGAGGTLAGGSTVLSFGLFLTGKSALQSCRKSCILHTKSAKRPRRTKPSPNYRSKHGQSFHFPLDFSL